MIAPGSIVVSQHQRIELKLLYVQTSDRWGFDDFDVDDSEAFVLLCTYRHPNATNHNDYVGYVLTSKGPGWCTLELSVVQLSARMV